MFQGFLHRPDDGQGGRGGPRPRPLPHGGRILPTAGGGGSQDGQGEAAGGAADQTAGESAERNRPGIHIDI